MRWHLVDAFQVLKKGCYAKARKSFSGDEDFFREYFPEKPLVPETLYVEMVAQTGGVLFGLGIDFQKEVILAKISEARFHREVSPPCDFLIEARIEEEREDGAWIFGTVFLKNEVVAETKILLATLPLLGEAAKKVVFNDYFMEHFKVWEVAKMSEALL